MKTTIEMACEAGWTNYDSQDERFKAFEALVRADEREALLDLVDDYAKNNTDLKAAILARGNT